MTQPKPDVLIIGAGPTGLMLACQLARHGIPFRIISKEAEPTTQSRALVIQARSMEIFAQMGIVEEFVAQGLPAKAINYVVEGKLAQRLPLSGFGQGLTAFPYLLVLEQSKTERILLKHLQDLGHDVEWQTELTDLSQTTDEVRAVQTDADGSTETATVDWLVGADGARSPVREHLGIPFGGKTHEHKLFVIDCKVSWDMPADEMYVAFSRQSFGAFFPMPDGRCRVAGILPKHLEGREEVSFEEINQDFATRLHTDITLSDPSWVALYHAHHRYVASFRSGRCFLAGDAAHIHSPVGAQGMNTGLQDAYNLAWKLAFVIQRKAKPALLDTYTSERLPIARNLVRTTDRAFSVTVSGNPLTRFGPLYLAPRVLPLAVKLPLFKSLVFRYISEIGIRYRGSTLARQASRRSFPRRAPRPGDRLPYVPTEGGNLQDHVDGQHFGLLILAGDEATLPAALETAIAKYPDLIAVSQLPRTSATAQLYRQLGITGQGYYLVRPDLYVACRSQGLDAAFLEQYLTSHLS